MKADKSAENKVQAGFRLSPEISSRLDAAARATGISKTAILEDALEAHLLGSLVRVAERQSAAVAAFVAANSTSAEPPRQTEAAPGGKTLEGLVFAQRREAAEPIVQISPRGKGARAK
jgi:predicted transcriptional regulator